MPSVNKSALVSHSASKMFGLVDDIESYPEFLPWCGGSSVISRDEKQVKAQVEIAHKGIRKSFTTINTLTAYTVIEMQLVDGPFSQLHGHWQFYSLKEDACKVSLDLQYEFSNKLLALVVGPVFNQIANTLVDAFCERADILYGK